MQAFNVLVTFCSRTGNTERLALAAAVGSVQARANIRLRWLREAVEAKDLASIPGWKEHRADMEREYIAPREIDVAWADALFLGVPARLTISAQELKPYWELLENLRAQGKLQGKVAAAFASDAKDGQAVLAAIYGALAQLGFVVVQYSAEAAAEEREAVRLQAHKAAEVVRGLKSASTAAAE